MVQSNDLQNRTVVGSNPAPHSTNTKYVLLEARTAGMLVVEVNALIRLGWVVQGGVAKASDTHYIQAMVKFD